MGIKRKIDVTFNLFTFRTVNALAELAQIIHEHAPDAIKSGEIKNHFGRKVAIVSKSIPLKCYFLLIFGKDAYAPSTHYASHSLPNSICPVQ